MDTDALPKQKPAQAPASTTGTSQGRKGMWTLAALLAYFLLVTGVITFERHTLLRSVQLLETVHEQEERQVSLNMTVAHAILTVNENYFAPDLESSTQVLVLEIEAVLSGLRKLVHAYPVLADDIATLEDDNRQLLGEPTRGTVAEIRSAFHRLVIDLDAVTNDIATRKQGVLNAYRSTYNRVTLEWLLLVVAGIGVFGGIGIVFFRRLARDIELVRARATDIVRGFRGEPLAVTRRDEMGALMSAVNTMQLELRERETQIELHRQQQFHKEKMAAVGSLAAAVAHEINNPMSAIVGVAEAIADQSEVRSCAHTGSVCQPNLILDQARRVMQITRQISEFSVPRSPEPELLDLNGLIRSTCGFVSFDRRFRGIDLEQALDPTLPAVRGVADHLVQVMMNVLINAADALAERKVGPSRIQVRSSRSPAGVRLEITDNADGIDPAHLPRVFEQNFTTKPPGRGSGLGLSLCRRLVEEAGGSIGIESSLGQGTRVTILLPLEGGGSSEAGETCTS
ncbi:MAG: two-component sensor histidine kinase [Rhodocyclaceae bacterium]|nr:two-component sensor histidine kinase [Rhodocyclaceae bacterium]